jgi:hypothetical protein
MPRRPSGRVVRPVVLIVGEGYAECELLRHVRSLYTAGRRGHQLAFRNARGKGASHVVDYAIRLSTQGGYDSIGAIFDTDTGLDRATRTRASQHGIVLLRSDPCLEAWLLATVGRGIEGPTAEHKRRFRDHFHGDADEEGLIPRNFPRPVLDAARAQIEIIDRLLRLIGV